MENHSRCRHCRPQALEIITSIWMGQSRRGLWKSRPAGYVTRMSLPAPARIQRAYFRLSVGHEGAGIVVDVGPASPRCARAITSFLFTRPNAGNANLVPAQDQSMHRDPGHSGQGTHAGRHQPFFRSARISCTTTWAVPHSRILPCCPKFAVGEDPRGCPFDKVCYIGCA